jgi:hypothetical protein
MTVICVAKPSLGILYSETALRLTASKCLNFETNIQWTLYAAVTFTLCQCSRRQRCGRQASLIRVFAVFLLGPIPKPGSAYPRMTSDIHFYAACDVLQGRSW